MTNHSASIYAIRAIVGENGWMPTFSQQGKDERNCGQHCIAMIVGVSVQVVMSCLGKKRGTSEIDVYMAGRMFGLDIQYRVQKFKKGMKLPKLCILHVQHHWCLYFNPSETGNGWIFDSCLGIFPASMDRRRIKSFIEVAPPGTLLF